MASGKKGFEKTLKKHVTNLDRIAQKESTKEKRVVISNSIRADLEQKMHDYRSKSRKSLRQILDEALELYFTEQGVPTKEAVKKEPRQTDIEEFL